jgi:hypothetical protein
MAEKVVFDNVKVPPGLARSRLVDVIFEGIDQSGPSYEVRVFLNNPEATPRTPRTPDEGYIGSFHVYGYGSWLPEGDSSLETASHGAPNDEAQVPITKSVRMTSEATSALAVSSLSITAVAIPYGPVSATEAGVDIRIENVFLRGHRPRSVA